MEPRIKVGQRESGVHKGVVATGAGCGVLFGLVFAGFGLVFIAFMGKEFLDDLKTYSWDQVPCEISACDVAIDRENQKRPFSIQVEYAYQYEGEQYRSTQYRLDGFSTGADDYQTFDGERRRLLGDRNPVCWVNPEDPSSAVIKRGSLVFGLFFLVPLLFVGIGGLIVIGSFKGLKLAKSAGKRGGGISARATPSMRGKGRSIGVVVLGIFLLVGLGLLFPLLILPVTKAISAQNWPELECQIIWSRVQSHAGDNGTTYSVDIFYEYEFQGETYRSNRYSYLGGSSSGRSGKTRVVRQYPEGSTKTCYVDPSEPLYAVLNRDFGYWVLLGLIPIILVLIGLLGLIALLRSGKGNRKHNRGVKWSSGSAPSDHDHTTGSQFRPQMPGFSSSSRDPSHPKEFRPGGKRLGGFFVILAVAAFWNGIVSVFLFQVIEGFQKGKPSWFETIFLTPFLLIGVVLIGALIYTFLAIFNPKPKLRLRPGHLRLGAEAELEWRISAGAARITELEILIEGSESATYRRGTNTRTETKVFYRRIVGRGSRLDELYSGRASFSLPSDLPVSIDTGNNKIEWTLKVEGAIRFWPDVNDRYPIDVRPFGEAQR